MVGQPFAQAIIIVVQCTEFTESLLTNGVSEILSAISCVAAASPRRRCAASLRRRCGCPATSAVTALIQLPVQMHLPLLVASFSQPLPLRGPSSSPPLPPHLASSSPPPPPHLAVPWPPPPPRVVVFPPPLRLLICF